MPGYEEPNEYSHWMVIDGKIAGTWKRIENKNKIAAEVYLFIKLNKSQQQKVKKAVKEYVKFWEG
ncbi:MAG: hypothetical protein R6W90_16385, partial [Ignavibacteriaceae bacterium]